MIGTLTHTAIEQRAAALRQRAEALLNTARQERMQSQIRLAIRDIEEAELWGRSSLKVATQVLLVAELKLDAFNDRIRAYGPDVTLNP